MTATIRKHGSPDYGYWIVECDAPECRDINGRPWQHVHSRRTIEGHTLAVRDMTEHNSYRHGPITTDENMLPNGLDMEPNS